MSTTTFETPDGAVLSYRYREGAGIPLVLAHPHTGCIESFLPLLEIWSGPALLWDRRGYGGSGRGRDRAVYQAEDLRALLDHLGIARACLVGIAAGGAVVASFALQSPGRVAGLGLACSFIGQPARFWQTATGEAPPDGDAAERELSPRFRAGPHAVAWQRIADAQAQRGAGEPPQPCQVDLIGLADLQPHIATGTEDRFFTPAMLTHAANLLPGATVTLLEGVAHAPHVEDPAGFARWIARVHSGA